MMSFLQRCFKVEGPLKVRCWFMPWSRSIYFPPTTLGGCVRIGWLVHFSPLERRMFIIIIHIKVQFSLHFFFFVCLMHSPSFVLIRRSESAKKLQVTVLTFISIPNGRRKYQKSCERVNFQDLPGKVHIVGIKFGRSISMPAWLSKSILEPLKINSPLAYSNLFRTTHGKRRAGILLTFLNVQMNTGVKENRWNLCHCFSFYISLCSFELYIPANYKTIYLWQMVKWSKDSMDIKTELFFHPYSGSMSVCAEAHWQGRVGESGRAAAGRWIDDFCLRYCHFITFHHHSENKEQALDSSECNSIVLHQVCIWSNAFTL